MFHLIDCDSLVDKENDVVDEHGDLSEADKFNEGPGPMLHVGTLPFLVAQLGVPFFSPGGKRDDIAH